MNISSTAATVTAQLQPSATRKADAEGKTEGTKPDGDNDADDMVSSVQQSAGGSSSVDKLGLNLNVVA